jgi:IS30 family transposase
MSRKVDMGRLTQYEREKIEFCFKHGLSGRAIAKKLGRHHSVVERELKRNRSPHFKYDASKAQCFSSRRVKNTNKRKILKSG